MRIPCCIPKATNTHPQYVILFAFQWQHMLHERASMLRYTYTASRVLYGFKWALGSVPFNIPEVMTPTSVETVLELMDKSSHFFTDLHVRQGHHTA